MFGLRTKSRSFFRDGRLRRTGQPLLEELETRTLMSTTILAGSVVSAKSHPSATAASVIDPTSLTNPSKAPFTPGVIRNAYGVNLIQFPDGELGYVKGDGTGETIAIADAFLDPYIASDLQSFDTDFGLPAPPSFHVLNEAGGTDLSAIPLSPSTSDWTLEQSLDVEWAHTIAPNANIVLFEANSNNNVDLDIADTTAANPATYAAYGIPAAGVVSNSFGSPEGTNPASNETQADEQFEDSNYLGPISNEQTVTLIASAGDNGVQNYPSVSPYVLSVGGTGLTVKTTPFGVTYSSETAWRSSGGGTSLFEPEPTFQSAYGITSTGGLRATPDVAEDANPSTGVEVYDTTNYHGLVGVGGTSLSAPLWAGLLAITDQGRALAGEGVLANAQEAVYGLSSSDYHDITSGRNSVASAGPGYDEVTGLGTPIANKLVPDLVNATTGVVVDPGEPTSPTPLPPNLTETSDTGHGPAPIGSSADNANVSLAIATVAGQSSHSLAAGSVTIALSSNSSVLRTDTTEFAALPAHASTAVDAVRGESASTFAAVDTDAVPVDASQPANPVEIQAPTAVPAVEFAGTTTPVTPATVTSDAVFADYASTSAEYAPVSSTPALLVIGEETHSLDMAMMAGLALAVGGAWSGAARGEEVRKVPALRS